MEADLGSVTQCSPQRVQRRMLGKSATVDVDAAGQNAQRLAAESKVRDQLRRLRAHLDETVS